jgi:thiol-disulfide isomerase/thioredoxin
MLRPAWLYGLLLLCAMVAACSQEDGTVASSKTGNETGGEWLIVNYWAEWCGPCRTEVPELNSLNEELDGQEARVVGVNYDGLSGEALRRSAEALGIQFDSLQGDALTQYDLPRPKVLPTTYIIDHRGAIRMELIGEQKAENLKKHLTELRAQNR